MQWQHRHDLQFGRHGLRWRHVLRGRGPGLLPGHLWGVLADHVLLRRHDGTALRGRREELDRSCDVSEHAVLRQRERYV
jgi:hypothetical protein